MLDQERIEVVTPIASRLSSVEAMPDRAGIDVAFDLGDRYLVRYLVASQLTEFLGGSSRPHWVTPTPLSPVDVISWLALFAPTKPRHHLLLIDPAKVEAIRGPAWVRLGQGIEYYLPDGFPQEAIVDVGVLQVS
ncbi:hypothetical protein [Nocardioides baculatus]|uniref:hypothetical protein n=1 Tax=Nocardioides baculatus TaxID=2801337 RepID=UPI001F1CCA3D|nr:hypothetical protein [Nocardioides baculatus]